MDNIDVFIFLFLVFSVFAAAGCCLYLDKEDNNNMKIVDFTFCNRCVYLDTSQDDEPCYTCLKESAREDSHRPINYKEDTVNRRTNNDDNLHSN